MTQPKQDHWSTERYKNAAGFVPKLTTTVLKYLDPQPEDNILDIGCGDGILTAQIAASLSAGGRIHGLDASQLFISTAKSEHQPSNCSYELQDCTRLENSSVISGQWDKVFSNAALHWILCRRETRQSVLDNLYRALKPGGHLVFEMGGKGNVAEIHAAFNSALLRRGLAISKVKSINPWFFPSTDWMTAALEQAGFRVDVCELEYRPTKTVSPSNGQAAECGLTGWLRLMGAQFLEAVPEEQRDELVSEVNLALEDVVTREEDGSQWIGYVRLRAVATKQL